MTGDMAAPPAHVVRIVCRVTRADVDAMLDAYDSGMCNTITGNCLSRALARRLQRREPVPLIRHRSEPSCFSLNGHRIPVPPEAIQWLEVAEFGGQLGPTEFTLEIPRSLIHSEMSERHDSVSKFPLVAIAS
jgi:hypothetical protein